MRNTMNLLIFLAMMLVIWLPSAAQAAVATDLDSLAEAQQLLERGETDRALAMAAEIRQKAAAPELQLRCLAVEVAAARAAGRLPQEQALHTQRLALAGKVYGAEHVEVGLVQVDLAVTAKRLGQAAVAAEWLDKATAVAVASAKRGEARSMELLAELAAQADDGPSRRQAVAAVEASLVALQGKLDPADFSIRERARALLTAVATVAIDLGRARDAVQFLVMAAQFLHPDRAVNDPQTGVLALELGRAWAAQGNLAKAEQFYRYALEKLQPAYGADHPLVAVAGRRLGLVLLRAGQRPQALQVLRAAQAGTQRQRQAVRQAAMPAAAKLAAYNKTFFDDEVLFSLQLEEAQAKPAALATLVELQLQRKGALLQALLPAQGLANPAAVALRQRLAVVSSQLAQGWQQAERDPGPANQAAVQRLMALRDQLEAQLAEKASDKASPPERKLDAQALCSALPKGAVLVDFVHYIDYQPLDGGIRLTRKLAALVVRQRDCHLQALALGDAKPIELKVHAFRRDLQKSVPARGAAALGVDPAQQAPWQLGARDLWTSLVAPLQELLVDTELLVLSPDDALHFVPWPALEDGDGKLLADRWPVALVDSPLQLIQAAKAGTAQPGEGALVLGGAQFGKGKGKKPSQDPCSALLSTTWAELPGTLAEARHAATTLTKAGVTVNSLLGAAATEGAFKHAAPGKRWISLATHGYFAGAACAREADLTPRDPLLLSGLVVAGANQAPSAEDGWLTAAEIAALDLRGTELVVLSACETGLGDAQQAVGEGVFGLRQAFARAGAAGVVLSLWQVPDRETAALMGIFWQQLAGSAGATRPWQALHRAQLAVRQQLAAQGRDHPYLWAGFVYAGRL